MKETDKTFLSQMSKVFDEAENRVHSVKTLFVSALA